jgi:hypothetical protein
VVLLFGILPFLREGSVARRIASSRLLKKSGIL